MIVLTVGTVDTVRRQVSMTEEQAETLRRLAALLRDAPDELLDNEVRLRRIERARAACGAFRSDLGPAAGTDHDAQLDGAFGA